MIPAKITLFLPLGDPRSLRTAEISNWNGKAIAAPRTELDHLMERPEVKQAGVYILTGTDPETGRPQAYVGEAEIIRDRLKQHKAREFWVQVIIFISMDGSLTRAHIRYLEGRLIEDARKAGRVELINTQPSGAHLPEADRAGMEVFLANIHQLLPVLGSDIVTPIISSSNLSRASDEELSCSIKGLVARGRRTPNGFVVFQGSQAVVENRPSAQRQHPYVVDLRERLAQDGTLAPENGYYRFTKDTEFPSPSAAASVVLGGGSNGLIEWKDREGRTLKEIEAI